ncbi:hypothetical protein GCM10018962_46540 [Dactylosporangium matsuzakiense]|uniref:Uncharacterized protein n=1 Tax=Dactylosporangium matsuzakiense TaxID=53360 RepID=A0A9W6KLT4_9ACTN|nr:hypothetical protein GCM10017581_061430 [Dactylosporangium matsuzakiense]
MRPGIPDGAAVFTLGTDLTDLDGALKGRPGTVTVIRPDRVVQPSTSRSFAANSSGLPA